MNCQSGRIISNGLLKNIDEKINLILVVKLQLAAFYHRTEATQPFTRPLNIFFTNSFGFTTPIGSILELRRII